MARLLDRLTRSVPAAQLETSATGFATLFPDAREPIPNSFLSYASSGYMGNGVVFACVLARLNLFAQATFKFQNLSDLRLFGTEALRLLESPWPGGTTGDLLARMEQDASLSGNAFVWKVAPDRLVRLRPDRVQIVSFLWTDGEGHPRWDVDGYVYTEDGRETFIEEADVCHWTPVPDPLSRWRGMSWLTPVVREINSDLAMTDYKTSFFENSATPNLLIRYQQKLSDETMRNLRERWQSRYGGSSGSGATVVLDEGADITVVGQSMQQIAFETVQAAGENRIASAAGVPPLVVGLKEGLAAATYSNFEQALKAFANGTMARNWQSAVSALGKLIVVPAGARLWYDTGSIAALQDAETAKAEAGRTWAVAAGELIRAGYEPDTVASALLANDFSLLVHSGAIPTALYPNGVAPTQGGTP